MGPFEGGGEFNVLKGPPHAIEQRFCFLTHLGQLKGHLALTYLIKNWSIGVAQGALLSLFWIFEYVTDWPFAGPLITHSFRCQKVPEFLNQRVFGIVSHKLA